MRKVKQISISLVAMILAGITMLLLPAQVMAQPIQVESNEQTFSFNSTKDEDVIDQGNIIGEDIILRDEYTKYFITDTGCTIAAQYATPVHYQDDSGEYVNYDNSLISSQATNFDATVDESTSDEISAYNLSVPEKAEDTLTNKKSDAKVSHFKKTGKAKLIEITKDGHTISWGYSGANVVTAKEQEPKSVEKPTGSDAYMALPNLSSTVVYENIYSNIDLEVINSTVGVKENFILKDSNTKNVFKIEYNIGNLTAENTDSRTIVLKDGSDKSIYTISAPYMKDASGEISEALELKILSNNKGKLSVKLTADKTWLKDKSRVYPVTVDPSLQYGQTNTQITSVYVDSQNSTTNFKGHDHIYQGSYGQGTYESYLKIKSLPNLSNGDMIVNVTLNQYLDDQGFFDTSYVGLYEVDSSWSEAAITWNEKPDLKSALIDYELITASDSYGWKDWDITELVKGWYNGNANNGFALKAIKHNSNPQCIAFMSSNNTLYPTTRPCLVVSYRNNKGLENHWSYTSIDCGRAGTAYINDYSGNLVFEMPLTSTSSPVLSAGLSYYYNSYYAGEKYKDSYPYTGRGWKMNIQQTLYETSEDLLGDYQQDFPYVYTDADGTEHYFCPKVEDKKTKYYDEDGYGLELKVSDSNTEPKYTIKNKSNEKFHFNKNGLLTKIENKSGQCVSISYSGNKITSIKDADGNTITYEVNDTTNNYIKKVTNPDGKVTTVNFSGSKIGGITYNDGKSISFTYDDAGKLLSVTDVDGSKVKFTYSSYGSKGVASVCEYGTEGTQGQKITFDRTKYNTTTIRTSGTDGVFNNSNDIITTCQFNNFGMLTSTNSKTVEGEYLSASDTTYTSGALKSDASNIKTINKVSQAYTVGANTENMLKNHNLEGTSNWKKAAWGSGDVEFSVTANGTDNNVLYGQNSLKMEVTSVTNDARGRIYQNIDEAYLELGATYTLSCYVKVTNMTPIAANDVYGAVVGLTTFFDDGTSKNYYSEHISKVTDTTINEGFRRLSVTITIPKTATNLDYIKANLAIHSAKGTAYFDGVQLEKASAPGHYNMLENASFERLSSSTQPTDWTGINLTDSISYDCISNANVEGNHCYRITGSTTQWKNLYQNVYLNSDAKEEDTYILSGWATGDSVPIGSNNAKFRLLARVYYKDGKYKDKADISFNDSLANVNWQYASGAFNLSDEDDKTTKEPLYIKVYLVYNYQGNRGYFDNLMLTKEAVPSYTYDDEGNLVSVVANAEQNSTYKYTDDLLTSVIDPENNKYDYEYDDYERVTKATSASGLSYNYLYDSKGNVKSVTAKKDINMQIKSASEVSYPAKGADEYTVTVYDQNAYTSTSVYNAKNGTLKKHTDNNGNVTNYTYLTANDLPDTITSGSQSVKYYYDNKYKHLTSLKHGNTTYGFTYDEFGNRIATMVGSSVLATNTFGANNGYLEKLTYGNNDTVEYTYDHYGNISTVKKDGVKVAENFSNSMGLVMRSQDFINKLDTRITYDTTGRLISKDTQTTSNAWLRSFEYDYDLNNNLTRLSFSDHYGTSNSVAYEYDSDNMLSKATLKNKSNNVVDVNYSYDGLKRPIHKTIATTNPIKHSYTYLDAFGYGSGYTTTYLKTEVSKAFTYRYEYDDNGNITKIYNSTSSNASPILSYVYDSYNQLIAVADFANNEQYNYTYDTNGNIKSLIHYEMDSAFTHPISTLQNYTYTYGKTTWGDLLTKWGGQTITYDQIGNPLNYRDGITMTWKNGRELASFENDDVRVTYTYDPDGLRTRKNYEGLVTTDYVYEGGLLKQMKYGSYIFTFSYDAYGSPIGFEFREEDSTSSTYYYYGVNSRGDVLALYNSAGTQVASYSYDPYGKPISTNTLVSGHTTAIEVQPLRYRSYVYDFETGLYYLQSRYYDPTTCRFINADGYVSTGQGITGNNMFAYCLNNPIAFKDSVGRWAVCASLGANATVIFGVSIGISIAIDNHGQFDVQWSYSVPFVNNTLQYGFFDVGGGLSLQWMNVDTVDDLCGYTTYIGASGGSWWYVGGDAISTKDISDPNPPIEGGQLVGGVGYGLDVHINRTYTSSLLRKSNKTNNYTSVLSTHDYEPNSYAHKLTLKEYQLGGKV